MRIIKLLIFLILLAYSVWFCMSNFTAVTVEVPLLLELQTPLFIIILLSVVVGMLIGYFLYTARSLRKSIKTREVKKQAENLRSKLDIYETEAKIHAQIEDHQ